MPRDAQLPAGCEILLLEDDSTLRKRLAGYLRSLGAEVTEAARVDEARRLAQAMRFDFALVDLHLPDGEALALLREGLFSENTGVVVMTAFGGVQKAVEAMHLGAGDYLAKPFEFEALPLAFARCRRERTAARREQHQAGAGRETDSLFFGHSLIAVRTQLDAILAAERRLSGQLPPVLIEGETGTGKSALARWLQQQGPRTGRPFLTVNCAALPDHLIESELFGHERGAFTDAKQARLGLFEAADGGTLFLDEIGALPASAQAKVLLAVEEGRLRRLGASKEFTVDVRIIAASNRPLDELVRAGAFRTDLFHRLNLLHIVLPPLRDRGPDLLVLARHLLARIAARHRLKNLSLSAAGEQRLQAQKWPGNVRELAHELERAVIFGQGEPLDFAHLPAGEPAGTSAASWRNPAWSMPESGFSLDQALHDFMSEALRASDGNISAAARRLGVTREFLRYRMDNQNKPET